jgi:hypothetical protein
MDRADVSLFLEALGAENIRESERWVNCSCPLAPYTHSHGADRRPSFGISVSSGRSVYICFTCSRDPKNLEDLLYRMQAMYKLTFEGAVETYLRTDALADVVDDADSFSIFDRPVVWPIRKSVLRELPLLDPNGPGAAFLESRGVSARVARKARVRSWEDLLLFPFTDARGRVLLLRARRLQGKDIFIATSKVLGLEIPQNHMTESWFGLHQLDPGAPVFIVEGEIDRLRLATLGYTNVVAAGGASPSSPQVAALSAVEVFVGFDSDKAGVEGAYRFHKMTGNRFCKYLLDWSIVGCKDPGDLKTREQAEEVIAAAQQMR